MPLMPGMTMATYPSAVTVGLFYRACLVVAVVGVLAAVAGRSWLRRAAPGPDGEGVSPYRNALALWLGALWLLDGVLQAQPEMATRFVGGLLAPLLAGQPAPVADVVRFGMRLWEVSPVWFNVLAVFLQIAIGLALLFARDGSRLRRLALATSIAWGLAVWMVGEAFGSLFAGGGVLSGSPGSVFLYILAAALVLLPARHWRTDGGAVWRWVPTGFVAFFALAALLQVLPAEGWWAPGSLSAYVSAMAQMPQPALVAAPLGAFAAVLARGAVAWNVAIAASAVVLALGWWRAPARAATLWATVAWTLLVWYFGQDFGVLGGMGTDPNTGAILLVFVLVLAERLGALARHPERVPGVALVAGAQER